ncbi:MAG: Ig domain-containing protein [Candidatus Sulfotelmatobacter sp.]
MPCHPTAPGQVRDLQFVKVSRRLRVAVLLASLRWLTACSGVSTAAPSPVSNTSSPAPLSISSTLPSATVGASYDSALKVSGGTAPYTFSMSSGQLPSGIALGEKTGTFSGMPAAAGDFSFAVLVADASGVSKQQALQLTVLNSTSSGGSGTGSGSGAGSGSGGTSGGSGGTGGSGSGGSGGTGGTGSGGGGTSMSSFSNLQQSVGWADYGQGPPDFIDCSPSPCDGITFSMQQGISSPSMSGSSTEFNLGGTAVYTDALFNNHLIGALSSQGMPDNNHTLVPTLTTFTYDVYFYGTNLELSQAVEFDVNQFFNSMGFIWGHECRIAGGNEWDIWDNVTAHWVPTGVPCYPVDNSWNHVTIQVQRTANNQLLYESISLNGVTSTLNQYYDPGTAPSNWYGVTINYQMDGNYEQSPYSVYLDELTFSYE